MADPYNRRQHCQNQNPAVPAEEAAPAGNAAEAAAEQAASAERNMFWPDFALPRSLLGDQADLLD